MEDQSASEIWQRVVDLLARVRTEIEEIGHRLAALVERIPDLLQGLARGFLAAWEVAKGQVEEFFAWFHGPLRAPGDPRALWTSAGEWKSAIGDRAVEQAQHIDGQHELLADDTWVGHAATVYATAAPAQAAAMQALGPTSGDVSMALRRVAGGIALFWAGVIQVVVDVVAGTVVAALSAASVVAAPAVPAEVIAIFVTALAASGLALGTLTLGMALGAEGLSNQVRFMPTWPRLAG
ncbi:hypothetical protein [Nocardioides insulae]|uniref:hypothetical protein n=1 Tax=Nocardioides insulae TaxID=394734 RepID=UPI00040803B2|nr:hypothetical protein [Nocardioides insulae]